MRRSQTISVSIDRPFDEVHDYLARPLNYQYWAAVEPGTFKPLENGDWAGMTPNGLRHFRFTAPNNFGVLDHAIFEPGSPLVYMPMRVMPNEAGSELIFTFFRRDGMDDAQFASTVEWIQTDFLTLQSLLEARNRG
ncbi:hypothetical protein SAMN05428969_2195 [Devosia sp. YR412]|uniref:hypothetical protein n=1 Tax=Devosia sp. YR412 TaxID=1881030 RepID=UPI0008CD9D21|nr:hypothetical protein [Devosia sp. YR412]SEQ14892.1 hypothetical protein SAMN05428969_2195 [Devosia sp. YR412]